MKTKKQRVLEAMNDPVILEALFAPLIQKLKVNYAEEIDSGKYNEDDLLVIVMLDLIVTEDDTLNEGIYE
jgi:hypothetical protein